MSHTDETPGFWTGLVKWRSRRFRIESGLLFVAAAGLVVWTVIPKFVSHSAWGGEVICAWYWGLGWYDEPGLMGRNYFELTASNAEFVVNYDEERGGDYRRYRSGRLHESGRMHVSPGRRTRDGKLPPRITLRGIENRIVHDWK